MKWSKTDAWITFFAEGRTVGYPCYPQAEHVWNVREAWKDFYRGMRIDGIRTGQMRITFTNNQF